MPSRAVAILVAILLASVPVRAEEVSDRDRFQLWNECQTVRLLIGVPPDPAVELTEDQVATTVRSCSDLQSSGLQTAIIG